MTPISYNPRLHRFVHLVRVNVPAGCDMNATHGVDDHPLLYAWLLSQVGTYEEDWDWEWDHDPHSPHDSWCFAINVRDPRKAMLLKLAWSS